MVSFSGLFPLIAALYGVFVAAVVWKLWRHRTLTFDTRLTKADQQRIRALVAYLGVPSVLLVATGAEAGLAAALGANAVSAEFFIYGSKLTFGAESSLPVGAEVLLAASGPVTIIVFASALIFWSVKRPSRAAIGFLRLEWARMLLWLVLVIFPVGSLLLRAGQFWSIQQLANEVQPYLGDILLAAYGVAALRVVLLWRGPWQRHYAWLASPLRDRLTQAERRLRVAPNSVEALRELARVHLTAGESNTALRHLGRALELLPAAAETNFLTGIAHLKGGRPRRASEHLRRAGKELSVTKSEGPLSENQAELYFEVTLGLAAARLALDDTEGAILTAEAATKQRPMDPRSALMHADALMVSGRPAEARTLLERALDYCDGDHEGEILRRLTLIQMTS